MTVRMLLHVIVLWVVFTCAGVLSKALGEMLTAPVLDERYRHACDTIRVLALILFLVYLFVRSLEGQGTESDLLFIGIFWFIATVIYEFVYKHYFRGDNWNTVFADYNILKGRLKALVLLTELLAPYLFGFRRHSIIRRISQNADEDISESSSDR